MIVNLSNDKAKFFGTSYVYTATSKSDPTTTYATVIDDLEDTRNNFCTCPGWKFNRGCRHMTEAVADLTELVETNPHVLTRP